jgi:hypothetical protein
MTIDLANLEDRAHGLRVEISQWTTRIVDMTAMRENRKTPLAADDATGRAAIDAEFADHLASLERCKIEAENALRQCEERIEEARKAPGRERRAAAADEYKALVQVYPQALKQAVDTAHAHAGALAALHQLELKLDAFTLNRRSPMALQKPGLRWRLESLSWAYFRDFYKLAPPTVAGSVNRPFAMRCMDMMEDLEFIPDDRSKRQ